MTEYKCDEKGCDYVARHSNPIVAKRMIGYHKSVVHNIRGVNWARNSNTRKKMKKKSKSLLVLSKTIDTHPVVHERNELTVSELLSDLHKFEKYLVAMMTVRKVL